MIFRGIVNNYTADLILRTKFKKIIDLKENIAQNIEVPVSWSFTFYVTAYLSGYTGRICLRLSLYFKHIKKLL